MERWKWIVPKRLLLRTLCSMVMAIIMLALFHTLPVSPGIRGQGNEEGCLDSPSNPNSGWGGRAFIMAALEMPGRAHPGFLFNGEEASKRVGNKGIKYGWTA